MKFLEEVISSNLSVTLEPEDIPLLSILAMEI